MSPRVAARFIRFGVGLLLVGIASGLLVGLTAIPRLAVATHVTMMLEGVMLICFGLIWDRVRLSERLQSWAFGLSAGGAIGNLITGMTSAFLGIGGDTLSVSAGGFLGSAMAEALVKIGVLLVVAATTAGIALVFHGLRVAAKEDDPTGEPPKPLGSKLAKAGVALVVLAPLLYMGAFQAFPRVAFAGGYPLELPEVDDVQVTWLWDEPGEYAQGWSDDDWQWFYHAPQGGAFELPVPYAWMMALEQPTVARWPNSEVGMLLDAGYLERFGFLANPRTSYDPEGLTIEAPAGLEHLSGLISDAENNVAGLPVGFTMARNWVDRATGDTIDAMGFTCAACHTGQIDYLTPSGTKHRVRLEGGPANVDLGQFRNAVGISLALTKYVPGRFGRFAERVVGTDSGAEADTLAAQLDRLLARGQRMKAVQDSMGIYPTVEGFARLDAIGRIGNFVFGSDLQNTDNYDVSDAPVNFPHIWDAPWFDWVQYNASFKQPMMRNAGESMGVFASVDMVGLGHRTPVDEDPKLFESTIDVVSLHEMEMLVRGEAPFTGLRSPEWPDFFPAIDESRVDLGRDVYERRCAGCHLTSPEDAVGFHNNPANWTPPDNHGNRYLNLRIMNLWDIGTDPLAAVNFYERVVDLGALGERLAEGGKDPNAAGMTTAGVALPLLIRMAKEKRYDDLEIPTESRVELDGYREDEIQAPLGYRARPLNGIWATPPFLHNGSVPNLVQLLGPQENRPTEFYLGSRDFDPDSVGLFSGPTQGGFLFDTSLPGNSNAGHLFYSNEDEASNEYWKGRQGVVGPALSEEEIWAVIEYMKMLPPLPPAPGG